MEVDFPDRQTRNTARAYVSASDGTVTALIGGSPHIGARELSELLLPIARLLQSEYQVTAAEGAASAAALAAKQTSTLAASLDEARRRLSEQAKQLHNALSEAARLNSELTALTRDLEQRVESTLDERRFLAEIVENTDTWVMVLDLEFRCLAVNRAAASEFERVFGRRPQVGMSMLDVLAGRPEHESAVTALWNRALSGEAFGTTMPLGNPGCDQRYYEMKFSVLRDKSGRRIGAYQFAYDVTNRIEADKRLAEAQETLRQSQKMEAVGQLAGGIAHDFNNMLTVIIGGLGQVERGITSIPDENLRARLRRSCEMAQRASQRSAKLTARLLAFSRRQPLDPKPIDANRLISGLSDMLGRTIGEQVRLEVITAPGLWTAQADVNELENAILNLAVNARDAMPEGGRLTIETGNTYLDEDYVSAIAEPVAPGQYVMIAITDTGVGMDPGTLQHAFEPFFTTKPVGLGTGLGLSQVYGFIRQSNGHVRIYSELGQGSSVKLYLPRLATPVPPDRYVPDIVAGVGGDETVLVVEDHEDLRSYSVGVLKELGYHVLEASNGPEALDLLGRGVLVDLLFTDVVLPEGMDGRRLAEEALRLRPELKVLFTTGYSRNAIIHNGRLDPGVHLLPKPFTFDALAAKVRAVLDSHSVSL
ncbi:ATP-binding protein [Aestuariivirga sp.]|uniref:PAS domain-containing sensor histidine kinase n=1 Tax=Aestuariivirga sp. TaxID=2650926 RepID=UPI00391C0450